MKIKKIMRGLISFIPLAFVASCALPSGTSTHDANPSSTTPTSTSTSKIMPEPSSTPTSTTISSSPTKERFSVTFYTNGGSSIQSQSVEKGSKATRPEDPTKNRTAQFTYAFQGWYKDSAFNQEFDFNTSITSNITLYAKWNETINAYKVIWKNYDESILEEDIDVLYGDTPSYDGEVPTKASENELAYTYSFENWSPEVDDVRGDATYIATFKQNYIDYIIRFVNYDGTEISNNKYHYGDEIEVPLNTPTKPSTVDKVYEFIGWDSNPTLVTENKTYTATYKESERKYSITWKNYDGTVLKTDELAYGSIPSYVGNTPEKPETDEYTYSFTGWDKVVNQVESDQEYVAQFQQYSKSVPAIYYTITWIVDGVETPMEIIENGYPNFGSTPVKESTAEYTYTFIGWSPALANVTSDVTYTAQFSQTKNKYIVTWLNDDDTLIDETEVEYGELPTHNDVAKAATAEFEYTFAGWTPTLIEVIGEATYKATYTKTTRKYTITWLDEDDSVIDTTVVEYGVLPTHDDVTKTTTAEYTYTFSGWTPEITAVTGETTYKATFNSVKNKYLITWLNDDDTLIDETEVEYGVIPAHIDPIKASTEAYTYEFAGWTPEITAVTGAATYKATFTEVTRKYTITWLNDDDSVIDVKEEEYQTLPTHEVPTKSSTAAYTYIFSGWTPAITVVTGDITYKATFNSVKNKYTITWVNDDNTTIDTTVVEYGELPAHDDVAKAATAEYTYTFLSWTPAITAVTGAATYKATFNSVKNKYTITWKNYDDSILEEDSDVLYGDTPSYDGELPTKAATDEYEYEFAGWTPEVATVIGNTSYKATFTQKAIDQNAISENTAYSFVNPASDGDIIITGTYQNTAAVTKNKITLDASNGKLAPNGGNENDHNSYQINTGTIISFSTTQAVKVTVYMWGNSGIANLYSITAPGINTSNTELTQSYTTNDAGTITITATANDYIKRIEIELVDTSISVESMEVVYLKTSKSSDTTAGNGTYKTINAKTIYKIGQSFDPSGIYGVVTFNNSTTEVVDSLSGLTFTGFDSSTAGKKTVTVSFTAGGKTVSTTYNVYVVNTAPSIVNNVLQVKVNPSFTGTIGEIVGGYNIFKNINQALDYLRNYESDYSSNNKLLYVSAGTYNEKLWIDIPNLTIYGANKTNTIIEYNSLYYNNNYASVANYKDVSINKDGFEHVTDSTQTVTIAEEATNCTIYDITISNYWNSYNRFTSTFGTNSIEHRALALLIYSDKVVVQDCKLLGYQDTLEVMTGRSYFYNSYISGATDFIFGTNPTLYFKNCEIHSIYNGSNDGGYINAFKGINKNSSDYVEYGVIYDGCSFTKDSNITSSNTAIARPWDKYSNVMVMNSTLDSHISIAAYEYGSTKNKRYVCWTSNNQVATEPTTSTVHFYEYNNDGLGALTESINGVTLVDASVASNYNNLTTVFGTANGYSSNWSPVIITDAPDANTIDITASKGYVEGAYVEFETNADSINAFYKKHSSSTYEAIYAELVRMSSGIGRVDVIGLEAGSYDIKLVDSSNSEVVEEALELTVTSDDRSGYAHNNYTSGVGAYNDNGTLKSDAVVIYVTEENKNTVTYNGYKGISAILKSNPSVPLDIRIIGTIGAATWNQIEYDPDKIYKISKKMPIENVIGINNEALPKQELSEEAIIDGGYNTLDESTYSKLNGLTNKIKYSTKTENDQVIEEFDSYFNVLDISNANNITVEGIGTDARIFQWGLNFKSGCNSIEVKNITFDDSPEDSCSFEGSKVECSKNADSNSISLDQFKSSNFWVHNCTFNQGKNYWDVSREQDKHEGDGSTDIRYVKNITLAYNHYNNTHKTGLIGSGSNNMTANVTLHHNWYENCQSRMPYSREANIHMYNNYYDSSTGTTMQIYDGAYAFIENCYFKNDNKTFELKQSSGYAQPAIKSYNNVFDGSSTYNISGVTITNDRAEIVSNGNLINNTFDTDSTAFYYDAQNQRTNVTRMDNASDLPTLLPTLVGAGICGGNEISNDTNNSSENTDSGNESNSGSETVYSTVHKLDFNDQNMIDEAGFFTILKSGDSDPSLSTNTKDRVYENVTYTHTLKIDTKPIVNFTTTSIGRLTLVCGNEVSIDIDGNSVSPNEDNIIIIENLAIGDHLIRRDTLQGYIYLIILELE